MTELLPMWNELARKRLHRAARNFGTQEELSKATGIPVPTLQKILKGTGEPGISRIALIANALGRPIDYFLTGISDESGDWETHLPVVKGGQTRIKEVDGTVSAGDGSAIFDGPEVGYTEFPTTFLAAMGDPDQMHIIRVKGDSMEPEINEGEMVIVDSSQRAPKESIFTFNVDGMALVKRLRLLGGGRGELISSNPSYPPLSVKLDNPYLIVGRVIWAGRSYR